MADEVKVLVKAVLDSKEFKTAVNSAQKTNEKATSNISKNWAAIGAAVFGAAAAIKKSFDFVKEFAAFTQSSQATERQFGISSDSIIKKLKEVSDNTISSNDAILSANRALALGVTKDVGQISQLLEIARERGKALGVDTTQAFNDIVTGIGRNSPLILDNLGIITKGWTDLAKQQGVNYDTQFILNQVLKDGAELLGRGEKPAVNFADKLQQVKASADDLKLLFGQSLVPIFNAVLNTITLLVNGFNSLNPTIQKSVAVVGALTPVVIALATAMGPLGIAIGAVSALTIALASNYKEAKDMAKGLKEEQDKLTLSQIDGNEILVKAGDETAKLIKKYESLKEEIKRLNKQRKDAIAYGEDLNVLVTENGVLTQKTIGVKEQLSTIDKELIKLKKETIAVEKKLKGDVVARNILTEEQTEILSMLIEEEKKANEFRNKALEEQQEGLIALLETEKLTSEQRAVVKAALADVEHELIVQRQLDLEEIARKDEEYFDKKKRLQKDDLNRQLSNMNNILSQTQSYTAQVTSIISQAQQVRLNNLKYANTRQLQEIQNKVDAGVLTEEEGNEQMEQANRDMRLAVAKQERKNAKLDKALAIIQIQVATGTAIAKAVAASPYTGGLPYSAIAAGIGTAQTAIVAAQKLPPLPDYQRGTRNFAGGYARINEAGGEIVNMPSGAQVLTNSATKDLLFNQPNQSTVQNVTNETINNNTNNFNIDGVRDISDLRNELLRIEGQGAFL